MNRILILKQLDAIIGRLGTILLPGSPHRSVMAYRRILVIRPGGIGDAVLLIPALQKFKEVYPDAAIEVLAEGRNAAVFAMCPAVDKILRYDRDGLPIVLRTRYDVVVDTEQWHRLTAVVARLVRAPVRIGYGTNERGKLFNHVIGYRHDTYEADSFFDLFQPLGLVRPARLPVPFLILAETAERQARLLLQGFAGRPYLVVFPGASIAERRWGADRFHQLARRLNANGVPVVVIGGRDDRIAGDEIVAGLDGLNLAGQTSLPGSAAVIAGALLLVSGDSGMLHIGFGLGRPTVSLFGSGIASKWAPRGVRHRVINKQLPCSPCTKFGDTPPCPIATRCLAEIGVDEVHAAVVELLDG